VTAGAIMPALGQEAAVTKPDILTEETILPQRGKEPRRKYRPVHR